MDRASLAAAGDPPELRPAPMTREERKVILGASVGTVFEWYDFYLYGALATIIAKQFFSALDGSSAFVFALLAFAAGFVVRPVGALVFGRLGDRIGRKYTFLVTVLVMGLATFAVGILPSYDAVGVAAPVLLVALRLLQGLALGGEYGGAAVYVAEHAPPGRRGAYTAWIQTTATLGLLLSLVTIVGTRGWIGEEAFENWGWRVPFLASIGLLGVSLWIRMAMNESPAFRRMKQQGGEAKAPLAEAFGNWRHLRWVIVALFGLTAGQAVVWYTGQFYAFFFLTEALKLDATSANILVAGALIVGTPLFIVFGSLSDRVGRKPLILVGCLLAALTYVPLFKALTVAVNPQLAAAQVRAPVVLMADPAECAVQFNPVAAAQARSSCDVAKKVLVARSVHHETVARRGVAQIRVGQRVVEAYGPAGLRADNARRLDAEFKAAVAAAVRDAGYPEKADPARVNRPLALGILVLLVVYVAMVYGPIAAALVELFPTRIRYTSTSLPYHLGNGWFGGLLPAASFAIVSHTGDLYAGLWYPIAVAAVTFAVGMLFLPETKDVDLDRL